MAKPCTSVTIAHPFGDHAGSIRYGERTFGGFRRGASTLAGQLSCAARPLSPSASPDIITVTRSNTVGTEGINIFESP